MPIPSRCAAAVSLALQIPLLFAAAAPARAGDAVPAAAVTVDPTAAATAAPDADLLMMTVILRHDQSLTLSENAERLKRQRWAETFPPPGVEVVSWTAVMGVGQIITLRLPPSKLREVNRAVADGAWGAFRTEFYPTYDYRPIAAKDREGRPNAIK